MEALSFNKAFTKFLTKYSDYSDVFLVQNISKLPKNTEMNEHTIKLEKSKLPPFGLICSLRPVELETLKIYIKTNLANDFIRPSKFLVRALVLFNKKLDESLCLCVNYCGFNNLTIKNQYLLSLIGELLD